MLLSLTCATGSGTWPLCTQLWAELKRFYLFFQLFFMSQPERPRLLIPPVVRIMKIIFKSVKTELKTYKELWKLKNKKKQPNKIRPKTLTDISPKKKYIQQISIWALTCMVQLVEHLDIPITVIPLVIPQPHCPPPVLYWHQPAFNAGVWLLLLSHLKHSDSTIHVAYSNFSRVCSPSSFLTTLSKIVHMWAYTDMYTQRHTPHVSNLIPFPLSDTFYILYFYLGIVITLCIVVSLVFQHLEVSGIYCCSEEMGEDSEHGVNENLLLLDAWVAMDTTWGRSLRQHRE